MIKYFLFFCFFLIRVDFLLAQLSSSNTKISIDTNSFGKWSYVHDPVISFDGKFVAYSVGQRYNHDSVVIVKDSSGKWRKEIFGISSVAFEKYQNRLIYLWMDTMEIMHLDDTIVEKWPGVSDFRFIEGENVEFLCYTSKSNRELLTIVNERTGEQKRVDSVARIYSDKSGSVLLIERKTSENAVYRLFWMSLRDLQETQIYSGAYADNFVFDKDYGRLSFVVSDIVNNKRVNSIWYFKKGEEEAGCLAKDGSSGLDTALTIERPIAFCHQGRGVIFTLRRAVNRYSGIKPVGVDVWSYRDSKLQSQQLVDLKDNDELSFFAVKDLDQQATVQLSFENEQVLGDFSPAIFCRNYVVVVHAEGGEGEWNWNKTAQPRVFIESTISGKRIKVDMDWRNGNLPSCVLSPDGKYFIFYNAFKGNYFSYSINDGKYINLTKGITNVMWSERGDFPDSYTRVSGVRGFLAGSSHFIIYSQNDIYIIDYTGKDAPINLTGRARDNKDIKFEFLYDPEGAVINSQCEILLNAFDRKTKDNGFYKLFLNGNRPPELLTMGPFMYVGTSESAEFPQEKPVKAEGASVFIVRRMSASESPNYFLTNDFRHFVAMSDVYPEKQYNWITSELINWTTFDGEKLQGILYKPENFDPRKRYPIIFYYYERLSEGLHGYMPPAWSNGPISVPYFVSNGYVVFEPDIHYIIGYPGRSAYNAVVSAAVFFSKKSWIDKKRMGLEGHSFGGFETDYIITHTRMFAAACSASGWADFIAPYNWIRNNGVSRQEHWELSRERIGATLWNRRDLYIDNSPILRADKIITPLLLMNDKNDDQVPFWLGVEFFSALRRLGKKAWMLQYDGEDHTLRGDAAHDFTTRVYQFFNYYLKQARVPVWMEDGIPAYNKGIDNGFELGARKLPEYNIISNP